MLDLLELFRIRAGGRPLLLFLILFLGVLALRAVLRGVGLSRPDGLTGGRAAWIVTIAGALALPAYVASATWYASEWHFFDNAEATMISVGWLFHAGQPIYHAVDAPERYTLIYGPLAYIVHGIVLSVFGPGIGVSKALAALAALASLALTYFAARREAPAARAAIVTGLYALLLLIFRNYSFWTRPEPFQLCTVAASLFFAAGGRGPAAAIAAGVASGMLWNFKITGPLYTLPVLALLYRRSGWRNTVLAAAAAALVFAAPFVAFPNVSLLNYAAWIRLSARTGLLFYLFRQNLEWAAFLLLPLLLSFHHSIAGQRRRDSNERAVTIALVAGMIGVVIVGAKPGAGPYHLMPFLPVIAYLAACNTSRVPLNPTVSPRVAHAAVAFVVVASIVAIAQQAQLVVTVGKRRALRRDRRRRSLREWASRHRRARLRLDRGPELRPPCADVPEQLLSARPAGDSRAPARGNRAAAGDGRRDCPLSGELLARAEGGSSVQRTEQLHRGPLATAVLGRLPQGISRDARSLGRDEVLRCVAVPAWSREVVRGLTSSRSA